MDELLERARKFLLDNYFHLNEVELMDGKIRVRLAKSTPWCNVHAPTSFTPSEYWEYVWHPANTAQQ